MTGAIPRRFSTAERDRRWQHVRGMMAHAGIDVIVVPPHTGHHDHFSAYSRYLTGIGGFSFEVGAVFPMEGAVTAITVPDVAPRKWQAQQDWIDDIRSHGRAFGEGLIARLREMGRARMRIGVAGLSEVPRFADGIVTHRFHADLVAAFPGADIVDCTDLLDRARYVKSDEEIAFLRGSVLLAEAAIAAMRDRARPGVTEAEVYAAMIAAMIERGGEIPAMIMWSAGAPEQMVSAGPPTLRRFERGDLLRVEVEGRWAGYCGQVTTMAALGTVSPVLHGMWALQQAAVAACNEACRPGITLGDLAERVVALAKGTPYRIKFLMHGRGLGDDRPAYVFSVSPEEARRWIIEENTSFITKPVVAMEGWPDVVWGDSVVVTADGAKRLGTIAPEIIALG
ncbi:MAG TPA: M24 family metallopeptidase [Stellaceae bacterium]|nr:M24 family metallopeptidase [Stellaceae bacterium]